MGTGGGRNLLLDQGKGDCRSRNQRAYGGALTVGVRNASEFHQQLPSVCICLRDPGTSLRAAWKEQRSSKYLPDGISDQNRLEEHVSCSRSPDDICLHLYSSIPLCHKVTAGQGLRFVCHFTLSFTPGGGTPPVMCAAESLFYGCGRSHGEAPHAVMPISQLQAMQT